MYHTAIGTQDLDSAVYLLNQKEEYIRDLERKIEKLEIEILKSSAKIETLREIIK